MDTEVLEFFKTFSRFEFTLKVSGYLRQGNNNNASPDWDKFVKNNKERYRPCEGTKLAVKALLSAPPNKQKVTEDTNGALDTVWEPMHFDKNVPDLKKLTDIILCIRNNLFHGGKYGHKSWDDKERTSMLLSNAVTVIRDWLMILANGFTKTGAPIFKTSLVIPSMPSLFLAFNAFSMDITSDSFNFIR